MKKTFWISLMLGFGTTAILYIIGFVANIDILIFKVSDSSTEFSILPIMIGLLVIAISERIMKSTN